MAKEHVKIAGKNGFLKKRKAEVLSAVFGLTFSVVAIVVGVNMAVDSHKKQNNIKSNDTITNEQLIEYKDAVNDERSGIVLGAIGVLAAGATIGVVKGINDFKKEEFTLFGE